MMEPVECGARPRKSRCNSSEAIPVSTSYGGSPRDGVGHRAELEVNAIYFCIPFF